MKLVKGNLWDTKDDIILVTTNAFVKKNGELVMGRGAAREANRLYPELSQTLGRFINDYFEPRQYGVLVLFPNQIKNSEGKYLGAFQVKYNWWENARLDLINLSTNMLIGAMKDIFIDKTCSMNFPGIGNGKLTYDEVYPIIKYLPDSVTIYMKED